MSQYRLASILPCMREIRRAIHSNPELSFAEVQTAGPITAGLAALAIEYRYNGPVSAVTARICGTKNDTGAIALRAGMDALPGRETTGLPFAPSHSNAMHPCGHDAHMTMLLGGSRLLLTTPPPNPGCFGVPAGRRTRVRLSA